MFAKAFSLQHEDGELKALILYHLGIFYFSQGEMERALRLWKQGSDVPLLPPQLQAQIHLNMGRVHLAQNDLDKALIQFQIAERCPQSDLELQAEILCDLGSVYHLQQLPQALMCWKNAEKIPHHNPELQAKVFLYLGLCFAQQGQSNEAISYWLLVLPLNVKMESSLRRYFKI